ncbi:DUF6177 family protein [Krasilnikovia sp. MM14-A1259]|uniref:DUF6177 family protein n=1 Tax=Krasilnikovia sp. MM14-A1259 TaxID=3373539 RepID=UPI0038308D36
MSTAHPAVDVLTRRVAVVMQDRPVVGLSTWLTDVIRICADNDKGLHLVTPATSRLTTPLHTALNGPGTRWVVRHDDTFYDGHTGRILHWTGEEFAPTDEAVISDGFLDESPLPAWHLTIAVTIRHRPTSQLTLGAALERLFHTQTGQPPVGWGTAEPATEPWNRDTLTDFCRDRAPRRTWLTVIGQPAGRALATLTVSRPGEYLDETIEATFVGPRPGHADDVTPTVAELAGGHQIRQLLATQAPGLPDTSHAPRWTGLATPLGLFAGLDALTGRHPQDLLDAGAATTATLGDRDRAGNWYTLHHVGEEPAPAWQRLHHVIARLNTPWLQPGTIRQWGQPESAPGNA